MRILLEGHPQFFRRRLRELGPRPLALVHLAAHDGDRAVFIQMESRHDGHPAALAHRHRLFHLAVDPRQAHRSP